jgi:hypothetical protein
MDEVKKFYSEQNDSTRDEVEADEPPRDLTEDSEDVEVLIVRVGPEILYKLPTTRPTVTEIQ